jgi:hypothetical protein
VHAPAKLRDRKRTGTAAIPRLSRPGTDRIRLTPPRYLGHIVGESGAETTRSTGEVLPSLLVASGRRHGLVDMSLLGIDQKTA